MNTWNNGDIIRARRVSVPQVLLRSDARHTVTGRVCGVNHFCLLSISLFRPKTSIQKHLASQIAAFGTN